MQNKYAASNSTPASMQQCTQQITVLPIPILHVQLVDAAFQKLSLLFVHRSVQTKCQSQRADATKVAKEIQMSDFRQ